MSDQGAPGTDPARQATDRPAAKWIGYGGSGLAVACGLVVWLGAVDHINVGWVLLAALALALVIGVVAWAFLRTGLSRDTRRLRIAVLTTAISIGVLAVGQIALGVNDHVRNDGAAECGSDDAAPTATTPPPTTDGPEAATPTVEGWRGSPGVDEDGEAETTVPGSSAPEGTQPATTTASSTGPATGEVLSPPADNSPHVEEFGWERVVRTQQFAVAVAGGATLRAEDFAVFGEDGRSGRQFARVDDVYELADGDWRVRVEFDVRCYSSWEGGTFPVTVVYRGDATVAPARWDAEVALQSRLIVYGLAALPWTMVVAIYLVFDVWPKGLKRWVGSLIGMGGATVGAYTASGLRNQSWAPTIFNLGALLGVTWAAATAAAVVAKKGGYDLADQSSVADQAAADEQRDQGGLAVDTGTPNR